MPKKGCAAVEPRIANQLAPDIRLSMTAWALQMVVCQVRSGDVKSKKKNQARVHHSSWQMPKGADWPTLRGISKK